VCSRRRVALGALTVSSVGERPRSGSALVRPVPEALSSVSLDREPRPSAASPASPRLELLSIRRKDRLHSAESDGAAAAVGGGGWSWLDWRRSVVRVGEARSTPAIEESRLQYSLSSRRSASASRPVAASIALNETSSERSFTQRSRPERLQAGASVGVWCIGRERCMVQRARYDSAGGAKRRRGRTGGAPSMDERPRL